MLLDQPLCLGFVVILRRHNEKTDEETNASTRIGALLTVAHQEGDISHDQGREQADSQQIAVARLRIGDAG